MPQLATLPAGHDAATRHQRASAVSVAPIRGHGLTVAERSALLDCYATPDRTFPRVTTHGVDRERLQELWFDLFLTPCRRLLKETEMANLVRNPVRGRRFQKRRRGGEACGRKAIAIALFIVQCVNAKAAIAIEHLVCIDPDVERTRRFVAEKVDELRGVNLAYWCNSGARCHAYVLITVANRDEAGR